MRASSRSQLGSTNWAFIIALLLLLVFVYMWWDETDKQDKMTNELREAKELTVQLNTEALAIAEMAENISNAVGWQDQNYSFKHVKGARGNILLTDVRKVATHSNPDGVFPAGEGGAATDGLLKQIMEGAVVNFDRSARLHTTKTGEETPHTFETLSAEFKAELNALMNQINDTHKSRPTPPADPDDTDGQAAYEAEYAAYMNSIKEYDDKLKALTSKPAYVEYVSRIRAPGTWGESSAVGVKVSYYKYTTGGKRTLQEAMEGVPAAFRGMKQELAAYINKANEEITQLRADKKAKEDAVTASQQQLQAEQEGRTNDVGALQQQLQDANTRGNANSVRATKAENDLNKARDDFTKTEAALRRDVEARKEQNRLLKEKRDLIIARDDPDGTVLASNGALGTATIDAGSSDKAYVGQKFVVSSLDRAGNRINRGEIMVVRVTGAHSAQVRILAGEVTAGDRIHNPFYERGERVYVFFAGTMDKWPLELARERLARLNVVVQAQMDGSTHYVIVPNSWTLGEAPAAGGGEDEEGDGEEGGAAGASPLEEVQKKARVVGANVITERLLDAFLDY